MVLSLFEEVVDRSVFLAFLVVEKGELNWSDENFEVEAILDHAVEEVNILSISVRFHFCIIIIIIICYCFHLRPCDT